MGVFSLNRGFLGDLEMGSSLKQRFFTDLEKAELEGLFSSKFRFFRFLEGKIYLNFKKTEI